MRDGNPPWLSIDLRVFKTREFAAEQWGAGIEHWRRRERAVRVHQRTAQRVQQRQWPAESSVRPDPSVVQEGIAPRSCTASTSNGKHVYNYAVARVRFRAPAGVNAEDLRLFFRLCTTGWSGLEYDTTRQLSPQRKRPDGSAAARDHRRRDQHHSMLCGAAHVLGFHDDADRSSLNQRTLEGAGNQEVHAYFGCWLDINDPGVPLPAATARRRAVLRSCFPDICAPCRPCSGVCISVSSPILHYTLDPISRERDARQQRQPGPAQHSARHQRQSRGLRDPSRSSHLRAEADGVHRRCTAPDGGDHTEVRRPRCRGRPRSRPAGPLSPRGAGADACRAGAGPRTARTRPRARGRAQAGSLPRPRGSKAHESAEHGLGAGGAVVPSDVATHATVSTSRDPGPECPDDSLGQSPARHARSFFFPSFETEALLTLRGARGMVPAT